MSNQTCDKLQLQKSALQDNHDPVQYADNRWAWHIAENLNWPTLNPPISTKNQKSYQSSFIFTNIPKLFIEQPHDDMKSDGEPR